MQDSNLQVQLSEAKAQTARLRERLSVGVPRVHKDLSLVSLVPRWSGADSATFLEEFIEGVGCAAQPGRWTSADYVRVAVLKLSVSARSFYNTCLELHTEGAKRDKFKKAIRQSFREVRIDQFHFTRLQTAKQGKNKRTQEFADSKH
jgi:hypothetical protein